MAVCLLVLLVAGAPLGAQTPPVPGRDAAPLWLVMPFENATGEPRLYWLSEGSAVLLGDALLAAGMPATTREDRVRAFARLRVPVGIALSYATVIRLGEIADAAQVIVGSFELNGDVFTLRARSLQLDTGRLTPEVVERGSIETLIHVYARTAARLVGDPALDAEQLRAALPPAEAFEQYVKGVLAESPATRIGFLNQALRLFPGYQDARLALWGAHTELEEHQAALNVVRFVPAAHRLARRAGFLAGVSLLHLGQFQQAYDAFLALHAESPDAALLNNVGIVQLRRTSGAAQRAASAYFAEAVDAAGGDPDLLFNLGYAHWLEGDVEESIHWLREVVRRRPADDAAHYVLGLALEALGQRGEAEREKDLARRLSSHYVEWEETNPAPGTAPDGLERVKTEFDVPASLRVDQVIVTAEQQDQRAVAGLHLAAGRRLLDAERDAEAIAELRRAVYLSPYAGEAHLLLGRAYLRTGRVQDAIEALTIAIWSEDTVAARLALAEAHVQAGDLEAARAELAVAAGREPESDGVRRVHAILEGAQ